MLTTFNTEKKSSEKVGVAVEASIQPSAPISLSTDFVRSTEGVRRNQTQVSIAQRDAKRQIEGKTSELSTVDESIVLDANSHTLDLPQVDFARPPATAPDDDKDPETDPVTELKPDYTTFAEIKEGQFVKAPDTDLSFIEWAEHKDRKENWIRKPNATTRDEILRAVNGKNYGGRDSTSRSIKVGIASVITLGAYTLARSEVLMPGQIYFTNNQGTQEIILLAGKESERQTIVSPLKKWGSESVSETVKYYKNGNITIANIPPGHVGFALEGRQPVILLPGRHGYNDPNFVLTEENIVDVRSVDFRKTFTNNLSIVRIQPTEIGIAEVNSSPVVLLPGLHIRQDSNFNFIKALDSRDLQSVDEPELEQKRGQDKQAHVYTRGPLSLIQVNRDKLGFAMTKEGPVVLTPGVYLRKDPSFRFGKFVDANAQYKHFYSIHLLYVRPNQVALVWVNNQARVLGEGPHQFNTRSFIFEGESFTNLYEKDEKSSKELLVRHGNYTIFRIGPDEYGYGFEVKTGAPKRIKPGFYQMNTLDFIFERRENVSKTHEYKGIHHVVVEPGMAQVITLADGTQRTLRKGTHNFTAPNAILSKPIDMKETVLVLHQKRVTLSDKTPLLVTGQISYRVVDPIKLINEVGQEKLKDYFDVNVDADLRQAFQSKNSSMIAFNPPSKFGAEIKDDKRAFGNEKTVEGDQLRGDICADIYKKLLREVAPWGVEILDVRISDMRLEKEADEATLAQATLKARTTEAQLVIQQAENATAQEKELGAIQRQLEVEKKKAEITAVTTKAQTESKLQEARQVAEAEALKKTLAAEAEAKTKVSLAQADAEAEASKIKLIASAEASRKSLAAEAEAKTKVSLAQADAEAEASKIKLIASAEASRRSTAAEVEAKTKVSLAKAEGEAEATRIKFKVEAEIEMETKKIAALAKANAEAKTANAVAEASSRLAAAESEAKSIFLIGKAKADAMEVEAKALQAKNEATLKVPEFLQLERWKTEVLKEEARAKTQTPAVVMGGASSERTTEGMFFGDGLPLIKYGVKQHGQFRRRNSTPSLLPGRDLATDEKAVAVMRKS